MCFPGHVLPGSRASLGHELPGSRASAAHMSPQLIQFKEGWQLLGYLSPPVAQLLQAALE